MVKGNKGGRPRNPDIPSVTKRCPKHGLTEYRIHSAGRADRVHLRCMKCHKENAARYYDQNKEVILQMAKNARRRKRSTQAISKKTRVHWIDRYGFGFPKNAEVGDTAETKGQFYILTEEGWQQT